MSDENSRESQHLDFKSVRNVAGSTADFGELAQDPALQVFVRRPIASRSADATGFDPRTVTKYLHQHDISNPWKTEREG